LRKITAILLLITTCIGYTGYQFICGYQIRCAKEQAALKMLKQIPENLLTKIEDDKTLQWSGDDELWYKDQMFDVVKRVSQNGKSYLMCIADADEAAALKKLEEIARSGSNTDANGKDAAKIKISLPDIFCSQFSQANEMLTASSGINYFYDYSSQLSDMSRKILLPPPKL
jgi:hypothetical protein